MVSRTPLILSAKILRRMVRLMGGHGSALPGLVIGKIDRRFLQHTLGKLPLGVVVVTGTNGKTTTTRMLVQLLQGQGLKVLSNPSGSNLLRGLISTVVEHTLPSGKLPYDIAVFELDEANAPLLTQQVRPQIVVALNVLRDQLDRYGEIDTTAHLIAEAAARAKIIVVNGNDELLMKKTAAHPCRVTFGLSSDLVQTVSSESNLFGAVPHDKKVEKQSISATIVDINTTKNLTKASVDFGDTTQNLTLPVQGGHNVLNAVAAILTTKSLLPSVELSSIIAGLEKFRPAFGRGETLQVNGRKMTVALIKNPSGFTQNVKTFVNEEIDAILIVINDEFADGRDVSWLWDSHVEPLRYFKGTIFVGGTRRYDMALRLKYEDIQCRIIDNSISEAMKAVMASRQWKKHLLIIPTYTAMLAVKKWIVRGQGSRHIW